MKTTVEFVDQLPVHQRKANALPLHELAARIGKWAILRRYNKNRSAAWSCAANLRKRLGTQRYEFAARTDGNGGGILYGRQVKK